VEIKDRFKRFADIFLSARKMYISDLQIMGLSVTTQCHVCGDTCLPSSCNNRVGKIDIELNVDLPCPIPTVPPTKVMN
jgi:hypothetical protein